ncbi:hypothetical protein [Neotamlana laminarinivorans]|uniref:Uncharacterized protein n=1 Tax=Neotamlana laminarinivorans TaxID=2883124 RepID=A0A9X1L2T1_9FLAO|nr:hypothetical protein [Tamlana laminarinivorans]MCB4797939.1 hypothetical protein [Tamlana laminarinivorans]
MKAATVKEIKTELNQLSTSELQELCLRLSRFKIENKELLTYLLFESHNEASYIESIKAYIDNEFNNINTKSIFYIKKSIRKILKNVKKYIRYTQNKATEAELLLYFCKKLKHFTPSISKSTQLQNMYNRQLEQAKKRINTLHEDLQYDFNLIIEELQ